MRSTLALLTLPSVALALIPSTGVHTSTSAPIVRRSALLATSAEAGRQQARKADLVATSAPMVALGFSPQLLLGASMLLVFSTAGVAAAAAAAPEVVPSFSEIMAKASKKALGGGLAGSLAGVIQVLTLMWMRTTMNYQYRYGGSTGDAFKALYKQGGIGRFYQGLPYALLQTPLSRFGDTAANTGVLAIFAITAPTMPIALRTGFASAAGSLWRILITPIDTLKTTMQVEGKEAMGLLSNKVKKEGPLVLYQGALANAVASFVGSYPWYFTFNLLREILPVAPAGVIWLKLVRNACAGFGATCVSDVVSNFIRVLKTTVQTAPTKLSYTEAAQQIIEKDGVLGLFTRGLGTRLITNGIQASTFSVLWKLLEEMFTGSA